MKSLRKAVVLALSLSLAMGGPLAEARPTQSSGSYKGGFSSQRSSTAKSTPSRSSPSAAPSPSRGSFGSFGSRRTPDTDATATSGGSRSAMNRDMSQKTSQDNAVRTMDQRTAQQNRVPPSDPRQAPQQPAPQYGNNGGYNNGGYNNNPGNNPYNGGYNQNQAPSRWGTAGAAAAGAVLGSVIAGGAHANQSPQHQQQPLPTNVPSDVGAIGPVDSSSTSPGTATVPNPMNPDAPAAAPEPAPQVQEQAAPRPARKEESGIGWFGWVMLGLIGFGLYKFFTRRKVTRQGANYSLGD